MGGLIAFEMARQLDEAGEQVALLALIEATVTTDAHCAYFRKMFGEFAPSLLAYIYLRNLATSVGKTIEIPRTHFAGWTLDAIHDEIARRLADLEVLPRDTPLADVVHRFAVFRATFWSMYQYPLRARVPYRGNAVVLSAEHGHPFMPKDAPNGTWRDLVGGTVSDRIVTGNHYTVCLPENVGSLAAALSAALQSAV